MIVQKQNKTCSRYDYSKENETRARNMLHAIDHEHMCTKLGDRDKQ